MAPNALAVALSLALAAAMGATPEAAAPTAPAAPTGPVRGAGDPPPGTQADQQLWRAARDASNELVAEQHLAARLQHEAKAGLWVERLADPARRGALPADRAEALSKRVQERWLANVAFMQSVWPVSKTRGCQYDLLNFEGVMFAGPSPRREAQLDETRRAVQGCLARAKGVLAEARKSTGEFREALAEVERALGPVASAPAPAALPAATPAPPGAGSATR
jgi:hypothetical protein